MKNSLATAMILNVTINEQSYPIRIPDGMPEEAADMFARMDADMDRGWQMSRVWVDRPDSHQRCQIVADRLLTAMENSKPGTGNDDGRLHRGTDTGRPGSHHRHQWRHDANPN